MAGFKSGGIYIKKRVNTPPNPNENHILVYAEDDGKLYSIDENGVKSQIGEGTSGGTSSITGSYVTDVNGISGSIILVGGSGIDVEEVNGELNIKLDDDYATAVRVQNIENSYVTDVNDISGSVTILEGTNIRVNEQGSEIIISAFEISEGTGINISGVGDNQYQISVEDYISATDVAIISSGLAGPIFNLQNDYSILANTFTEITTQVNQNTINIESLNTSVSSITGSLGYIVTGREPVLIGEKVIVINHPTINLEESNPLVSLTIPSSSSDLYVQAITNRSPYSFEVVLSDTPSVSGYEINWQLNLSGNAFIVKYYSTGDLTTPDAYPDASLHDTFYLLLDEDTTLNLPINMVNGQSINIMIQQDSIGNHNLFLNSEYKFSGGIVNYAVTQDPDSIDVLTILRLKDKYLISVVQDLL